MMTAFANTLSLPVGAAILLNLVLFVTSTHADEDQPKLETENTETNSCAAPLPKGVKERQLFDGKSLAGWKITKFGGEGTVAAKDGILDLGFGSFMTGVTYAGKEKLPTTNYELSLEAKRVEGSDFFCGLTVPYKDSHFSLIVGGWGGGVTGISSINGLDASENYTTQYISYKNGVWYCIRLRVTDENIDAWIDNKQIISFEVGEEKFSTRIEVDLSKPLGISTYDTHANLRNIRLRTWAPEKADVSRHQ
jgi:hypothetical protein